MKADETPAALANVGELSGLCIRSEKNRIGQGSKPIGQHATQNRCFQRSRIFNRLGAILHDAILAFAHETIDAAPISA
eukprot:5176167-Pyramimonas_sp.AAC.1